MIELTINVTVVKKQIARALSLGLNTKDTKERITIRTLNSTDIIFDVNQASIETYSHYLNINDKHRHFHFMIPYEDIKTIRLFSGPELYERR